MMRRAFAFLSILLFILSLMPCSDCYGEESSSDLEIAAESPAEDAHADDNENCSPFCCACCNFTISQKAFNIDLIYSTSSAYHIAILINEPVKHSGKIWQPPKC